MTKKDFEKLDISESPIFKHKEHGILIAGQGEYGGKKELCGTCQYEFDGFGAYDKDCHCQQDINFTGLWPPIDWNGEQSAPYFLRDENTVREMLNDDTWTGIKVADLEFTGKHCKA